MLLADRQRLGMARQRAAQLLQARAERAADAAIIVGGDEPRTGGLRQCHRIVLVSPYPRHRIFLSVVRTGRAPRVDAWMWVESVRAGVRREVMYFPGFEGWIFALRQGRSFANSAQRSSVGRAADQVELSTALPSHPDREDAPGLHVAGS